MAMMLLNKNATVTICHSRTQHIEDIIINEADHFSWCCWNSEVYSSMNGLKKVQCIVIDAGYHPRKMWRYRP